MRIASTPNDSFADLAGSARPILHIQGTTIRIAAKVGAKI